MAYNPFPVHRLPNTLKDLEAKHLELMHEAIAKSRELLRNTPLPDTFAGRRTHEPFSPKEDE
jgi:hypothetical protein